MPVKIVLNVSERMKTKLEREADSRDMTLSDYIRDLLANRKGLFPLLDAEEAEEEAEDEEDEEDEDEADEEEEEEDDEEEEEEDDEEENEVKKKKP